ncbi:MAG: hypothetical protein MJ236_07085, partial [Clostridia bacterium]|nr:hypothetical protein [Clostridia bacterium]
MKKLIPAICLLLISAMMLGTSTFAWFSMNTQVTATGMNVTAKSNAVNLLIGGTADCATTKTGLSTTVAGTYATTGNDTKACYPAAYVTAQTVVTSSFTAAANTWYTATNANPGAVADDVNSAKAVDEGDKDYMLTYKVWLTLSTDSEDITDKKVKVTFALGNTDDAAISAVVKLGTD